MKLSDAKKTTAFKLLQIAESGHGKTTRALSATRFGGVLVIDCDNKLTGMRTRVSAKDQELIEFEVPKTYDDIISVLDAVAKRKDIATVVLDTWSRAHDLTIEKHRSLNPKVLQFSFQDWFSIKQMNQNLLARLLALPQNIIVNTHVGRDKDAADRSILTVGTTGSFGSTMPQYFGETHYLIFDSGYKVRGGLSNSIVANTSLPATLLNSNGFFLKTDLSIFDEIAYKVGA